MFKVILVFTLFGIIFARHVPNSIRIVGGEPASINDYPYQISLLYKDSHACGGSILTEKFILTAAHCTYDLQASQLKVRVNSSLTNTGGTVVQVSKINFHGQFDINTYDYDISIIELSEPLTFGVGVQPISLIDEGKEIPDGLDAVATGYGRTSSNGPLPTTLLKVNIPTISTKTCIGFYGDGPDGVSERMFCAGEEGKDTCQGDSGGPLVVDNIQVGLVSWGDVCGQATTPGVYTKISAFKDYINDIVN